MAYTFKLQTWFPFRRDKFIPSSISKAKEQKITQNIKTRYSTLNARGNFCKPQSLLEAGLNKNTIYIK